MHNELWLMINARGVSLKSSGSSEKAFHKADAMLLLDLLKKYNIKPLGVEVWRRLTTDRYAIESLAGIACESTGDLLSNINEVAEVISKEYNSNEVIFTIQF